MELFDGSRLRSARLAKGWQSQSDLVAALQLLEDNLGTKVALGIDTSLVCKWEGGKKSLGTFYASRLSLLFGSPESIGIVHPRPKLLREIALLRSKLESNIGIPDNPSDPEYSNLYAHSPGVFQAGHPALLLFAEMLLSELLCSGRIVHNKNLHKEMNQRAFTKYLALLGGGNAIDSELLPALMNGVSYINTSIAEHLAKLTQHYMRQWDKVPPQLLLPAVAIHLDMLETTMNRSQTANTMGHLRNTTCETAIFAGLLSWYVQQRDLAERYLSIADGLAQLIGYPAIRAMVLLIRGDFHSKVQMGLNEGSALSKNFLEAANQCCGAEPSVLRAWILARQAEEFAVAGEFSKAQRHLDLADTAFSQTQPSQLAMFNHWNTDIHAAFRGNCAQLSGNYLQAADILNQLLKKMNGQVVSNRVAVQADLASVYAQQGEIEHSVTYLSQSLNTAVSYGLRERILRIQGIRQLHLSQFQRHPAIHHLDEQIHCLL